MFSEKLILSLVGHIYDAAGNAELWPAFLERFADAVESASTQIFLYDVERHGGNLAAAARLDPEHRRRYNEYFIRVDCFGIHGQKLITSGNVATGQMMCPDSILENSEFYNDFLRRMDSFHQLGGFIYKHESVASVISTLRPKRAGPFDDGDVQLLRTLMPHLQRAIQLHQRIAGLEAKADSAAEALDRIPLGFLVMDGAGKVLLSNRRAQDILKSNDGLTQPERSGRMPPGGNESPPGVDTGSDCRRIGKGPRLGRNHDHSAAVAAASLSDSCDSPAIQN